MTLESDLDAKALPSKFLAHTIRNGTRTFDCTALGHTTRELDSEQSGEHCPSLNLGVHHWCGMEGASLQPTVIKYCFHVHVPPES